MHAILIKVQQDANHEDTIWPPVGCRSVTFTIDNFWRHVLDCAAEWESLPLLEYRLLAETKVGQLDVAIGIK